VSLAATQRLLPGLAIGLSATAVSRDLAIEVGVARPDAGDVVFGDPRAIGLLRRAPGERNRGVVLAPACADDEEEPGAAELAGEARVSFAESGWLKLLSDLSAGR
jgi:hypothetical protein